MRILIFMKTPRTHLHNAYPHVSVRTIQVERGVYETAFIGLTVSDPIVSKGKDAAGRAHDAACEFVMYPSRRQLGVSVRHDRMARMLADAFYETAAA